MTGVGGTCVFEFQAIGSSREPFNLNFVETKEKMIKKFHMFYPKYVDFYDSSFRNEGSEFRWTFTGIKK